MPALIKGVVLKKRESIMEIKLITGKRFWTYRRDDITIREHVWIAWDYTTGKATRIMSEPEYNQFFKNEDPEPDVFSDPDDEGHVNEELVADDESWLKHLDDKEAKPDASEIEDRRFSFPVDGEFEVQEFEDRRFSNPDDEGLGCPATRDLF